MALVLIALALGLVLIIQKCVSSYKYYSPKNFPPGPRKYPVVGSLLKFRKSPLTAMMDWKREYGKIVGLRIGDWRTIIINDYELIKEAFNNDGFNGRPEFKPAMMFTGGEQHGTLTSEGDSWDTIRKFTIKNLSNLGFGRKSMESMIQNDISQLIYDLKKKGGAPVSLHGEFYIPAINHLYYILAGKEIPQDEKQNFREIISNLNSAIWQPMGSSIWMLPWLSDVFPGATGMTKLKSSLPPFQALIKDRIKEKLSQIDENNNNDEGPAESLIDAFVKEIRAAENNPKSHFHGGNGINQMTGMVLNLFVTAAESMNNALNWAIFYLSLNPSVQEKLAAEIFEVIGPNEAPSLDHQPQLPYTKAVMAELLRITTTSPFSNFQATTRNVSFHGYEILKDTMVIANLYGLHHDAQLWENPEEFRPERFLVEEGNTKFQPLIPFSVGLRTCLGQTFAKSVIFLMLTSLVQNFRFEWDENVRRPNEEEITEASRVSIFRFCPEHKIILRERNFLATP